MSIEVSHLIKTYGIQKALNDISFCVSKGEITGFLGPNGAGKSTTLKIITGFLTPDSGTATVCGIDIQKDPLSAKNKIGYLAEANPLYYDMYVSEYLEFVCGVFRLKNIQSKIKNIIGVTGLTSERKKRIGQLSKGYKQRVGLAAALIHEPEVLILDEPTSGLDPNQIIEIRNLIKEQGKNKTVLFSSHILQEVNAICDRVVIIHKGQIVADDTLKNLQQSKNQDVLIVSFNKAIEEKFLHQISGIDSLKNLNNNTWQISGADNNEIKKQLLQLCVNENIDIVSLQTEQHDLETIFRTLTQ